MFTQEQIRDKQESDTGCHGNTSIYWVIYPIGLNL